MTRTLARRRGSNREADYSAPEEATSPEAPEEAQEAERPRRGARRTRAERPAEASSARRPNGAATAKGETGWGGFAKVKDASSAFTDAFKFKEDEEQVIIKFVDAEPFVSYQQHWIERGVGKKKSFTCLGDDCPLCDELGDNRPAVQSCFNIIDFTDPKDPVLRPLRVGITVATQLRKKAETKSTSPLNRPDLYFAVSRTKEKNKYTTLIDPVKERDLKEDWDVPPISPELFDELAADSFDEGYVQYDSMTALTEIVEEVLSD